MRSSGLATSIPLHWPYWAFFGSVCGSYVATITLKFSLNSSAPVSSSMTTRMSSSGVSRLPLFPNQELGDFKTILLAELTHRLLNSENSIENVI